MALKPEGCRKVAMELAFFEPNGGGPGGNGLLAHDYHQSAAL